MADVVIPLFWKSDNTHPVHLNGSLEFGRFRLNELHVNGQTYPLDPPVEIVESDGFLVEHGEGVWKFQPANDNSLVIGTSFLVAEVGSFLGLGIHAEASLSARLTLRIPPTGSLPESFGALDLCAHVDVGGAHFCPDPICLSINLPKIPSAPVAEGSPELWFELPNIGVPVPRLPVPWAFPTISLPVRWSAYSANLRGIGMRVGWESLLLEVHRSGLKLVFERFQIDGIAGSIEADIAIAISRGGIDLANSSIRLRRGPSIPLTGWHVGDGCFSLKWTGQQFGELLALIAPGVGSKTLPADAEIAIRVLTFAGAVSEIRIDVVPDAANTLPIDLPGFQVSLPGGKQFSLVYLSANGSATAPPNDTMLATMSLAATRQAVARSTFTWTRFDDRELQNEGSGELLDEDPLIKVTATKTGEDRTLSLLELPLGGRPRLLRQYDGLVAPLWNGDAPQCDPTPWQTRSFDAGQWSIDFDFNDQLLDKFEMPFLNGETNGIGQFIKIKQPKFSPPDLTTSTVGGSVQVEVAVGPLKLIGEIGLSFNWETFAFEVDHGEGLDFVIDDGQEFSFLGLLWTFKKRADGGPFFKLITANSDYKLIQLEGSEIELRFTRATTEDQPIVFSVSNFEITEGGISLNAKVTEQPAKLNGLETEFRFKEGTFQIKENRILGFSIAGGGPLPPDLVGEATADIRLQFEQVGDSLELIRGSAKVSGNKLAHCTGTRFEFSLDALGLEFVNDGAYHLYFLVTGSAEYKPLNGDGATGLLSYMPGIKIKLVDCPLTGNARVIAQHVEFKLQLPEPVEFNLFGVFAMEIRGFGFLPQCDKFGGDGAVIISGQVKFASGGGDVVSAQFDFHDLYVGLPKRGSLAPRFYMKGLGVVVKVATSKIYGSVELVQDEEVAPGLIANGFRGTGGIEINGLPPLAAAFAFLRVIRPQDGRIVTAWFIYLEARRMSFKIPVIEIYLREVGLGLGYRYTLVGIKRADEVDDVKQLIKELKDLSRTQANLADHRSWTVDIEDPGDQPRLTVALRALITQTSAASGPFDWDAAKEENLPCLFLLDAVVALRSDLTFFMVARGWLNTNYSDFNKSVDSKGSLHQQPLISGFVLLSPKQKRFLAHVASNPGGEFGDHPPVLPFLKQAIKQSRFSATLLIEPGLVHAELGWPNMIRWGGKLGPLEAEFRGGAIFRTSTDELVTGLSYLATGSVSFDAGISLGFIGASLSATANVAYGARYIGVLDYRNLSRSAFYGGIGVEIQVRVNVEVWVGFKTFFGRITKTFHFDFDIHFTASLELGLLGDASVGVRGSGTFCLKTRWKNLHFTVHFAANDGAVNTARRITERFLNIGLEATEVDALPGVSPSALAFRAHSVVHDPATALGVESIAAGRKIVARQSALGLQTDTALGLEAVAAPETLPEGFVAPDYIIMQKTSGGVSYFTLLPGGDGEPVNVDADDPQFGMVREGFYAVPPATDQAVTSDYVWQLPDLKDGTTVEQFNPGAGDWASLHPDGNNRISWKMAWEQVLEDQIPVIEENGASRDRTDTTPLSDPISMKVKHVLRTAYIYNDPPDPAPGNPPRSPEEVLELLVPLRDPVQWPDFKDDLTDDRLDNPSDVSFEPVIRAAQEQFESAPYFRHDPARSRYEEMLEQALDARNDLYSTAPPVVPGESAHALSEAPMPTKEQQAIQVRSILLQQVVTDLRTAVQSSGPTSDARFRETAVGKIGMVFRITRPESLNSIEEALEPSSTNWGTIWQRTATDQDAPDTSARGKTVELYNDASKSFFANGARAAEVRTFEHENTIAIGWNLHWQDSQESPEDYLAYYAVTRRRIDDANSEIQFPVQNVDPLVREATDEGDTSAYKVRRIRSRFQIVDHFPEDAAKPLLHDVQYLYSVTPVSLDGTRGITESIVATRRPSVPPPVPTDARMEVLFVSDSPKLFRPQSEAKVHQPSRILVRWSEPVVPPGEPRIAIGKLRLVFRRHRTLPSGSYGVDADARGNVQAGAPATNARKLRTDKTFEWDVAVGKTVQVAEVNGRAVYFLVLNLKDLQDSNIVPPVHRPWRPEAWDVFLQAEGANGVRSSLAAVQIALQFAPKNKVDEILPKHSLLADNEPRVENREVAQLEWFAQPVVMPPLPANDGDRETGWALVPQPTLHDGKFGVFAPDGELARGYQHHPDRVRAIRFRLNQGPSGQQNRLDLHAGFRIMSFDVLAHDPERLVPNPDHLTWQAFTRQANLKTVQELELAPAEVLQMSPADTLTPRIWEAWYPSELRRIGFAKLNSQERVKGGQKQRAPWHSWRESILTWPDPLTPTLGDVDPFGLFAFHVVNGENRLRWQRGRHSLLDEILTRVQFAVIDPPELAAEFPGEWGVTRATLLHELSISNDRPLHEAPEAVQKLEELNKVIKGLNHAELSVLPTGTFITVTEPGQRWRALRPNGTSIRIERLVKSGAERWRILIPIGISDSPTQLPILEVIGRPWDPSKDLSSALSACEPESDPYGWNALQRLGLSVAFALRLPDQGGVVPARELVRRLKVAVEDACKHDPFDKGFKEHVHVELLYRSDRRMEIAAAPAGGSKPSSEDDLLSIVQVSLRPRTEKRRQYDAWTVRPIGMDVGPLRGKSVTLLVERPAGAVCHLVLQPGTPGAEIAVPAGAGANAARINVTIPAEGALRLLFRGMRGSMPTSVAKADPKLPLEIRLAEENLPPWDPSSAHFNWLQDPDWLDETTRVRQYIEALGASNETDAHESFRLNPPTHEIATAIQDWALRFFDYGGDADKEGTLLGNAWFATAYPRTFSPALVAPDAERKIVYDHFVDDRWASAYRNLVVPEGRYDKLWEFVAGSSVLFGESSERHENLRELDHMPALPEGGLDVRFPRIHPVAAPLVQLSSRLDEPSTPGRPAAPGAVWEVILERHPEQVLKESNHHLQARLEFHDVIWTRFRRFQFSERLVALQDIFYQRHYSAEQTSPDKIGFWGVTDPGKPFLAERSDADGNPLNPKLTFELNGDLLIDDEELPRTDNLIWKIRDRLELALSQAERDNTQIRIVAVQDGQLVLMFASRDARDIQLLDGREPSRMAVPVEGPARHSIAVRHVENQLDDSVALPNAPLHPQSSKDWKAHDWVERQGRIPIEKLSSDVRRMIDLPLRQDRIQGGAMVYQFDGIPYFYAQRLFFAARAGTEHSALTRLDHSDFHYVSPIPETSAEGLEEAGVRYRRIEIALSRYWDCLGTDARNRWPSESPHEPGVAMSVSSNRIVVGGRFGALHTYDAGEGVLGLVLSSHRGSVVDLLVRETPVRLYCIGEDRTVQRWDLEGDPPAATHSATLEHRPCSLAAVGGKIAVVDASGLLRTFFEDDLTETGACLVWDRGLSAAIGLPNGDWLVGGVDGKVIRVRADLTAQTTWDDEHQQKVTAFAISKDGAKLCSVGEDGMLVVWDVASESAQLRVSRSVPLTDVAISDDGLVVAVADQAGEVFSGSIVDFADPEKIGDHAAGRTSVEFVAAMAAFLSTGQDGSIQKQGKAIGSLDAGTFSTLPDTDVIYQYTLVKPGRVIETISEIRFDAVQPHGYLARDIAVGYRTSVVQLEAPRPGDARMRLITTLERDAKAAATTSFATMGEESSASLTFEAKAPGATGSRIQIVFLKAPQGDGVLPTVRVTGFEITVTLNTTPGHESNVGQIRDAVNADAEASQLVSVTLAGASDQDATYKSAPWTLSLGERATQWISSRQSFDAARIPAGAAFRAPHACRLHWGGALSIARDEEQTLREQIDELISPDAGFGVDASFREALLLLLKQATDSVAEVRIPAPEDPSVGESLFEQGRISLELVAFLAARGVALKLRSWMQQISSDASGQVWLAHSGNRTHRIEAADDTITVYHAVRDNVAEASIGLEQLAELPAFLGVSQTNPAPPYRTDLPRASWGLAWRGAMSQTQYEILRREENGEAKGWTVTSDFRSTLLALLEALMDHTVEFGFDGAHPATSEIPAILRNRLEIADTADGGTEHSVSWKGFILHRESPDAAVGADAEILQALDDLHDHPSGEEGFQQAVDALRKTLIGAAAEREIVNVPIHDQQWFPRPTDADLRTHFPELARHLMVRSGLLSFAGVMTQAEARTLFEQFKPVAADLGLATSPDQRACEELFADAFNSGLDGARIEVRTRRGSARLISREVEAMIDRDD